MTVTALHPRLRKTPPADAPWTLTIEVTVRGTLDDDARAVLRDLQRLAARPTLVDTTAPAEPELIRIDPLARTAVAGRRELSLSRIEFDLLRFLAENPGRVFTREHLLNRVWHTDRTTQRTVDVHIRRLRAKTGVALVTTVRGVGYRLADDARLLVVH
jgi:DNA-binding response OmpR family regulator